MTKKLLIDAHQPEETRVVLLNGNKIEEFDYENTSFKQLKGNVYLARVTRVEPSLQAAFVEYGGNRQGFLAFSEIHPDYYRIPIEDREALVEETKQEVDADNNDEPDENGASEGSNASPETLGGDDEDNESRKPSAAVMQRYKIQEVISRKQILLVQVVKEERGNKGAALTTYLSLAGRYCVLMPNSSRSGGVSRKITNVADRKRLKTIVNDLDVADGMAVIVRTAGAKRTKTEIKRDYAYLSKLWDEIRTNTLQSEAPTLIHEEGSLVKRAIRDIYTNDVDEVLVEGEDAYKAAKAQMKMLIPSHAKRVVKFEDQSHLFQANNVEPQLDTIHQSEVTLKSGGYLVINQTEALVAIDVNSGKATRERNIEETALKTNLEAAEEVGRQLKLRDLSGLIVIDFIDMDENRNQNSVERRLKDALRHDRARIQVGSISHFGLLEMSRQRLRPSLVESVSQSCPHCLGTGRVRSVNSSALQMLRLIEDEASRQAGKDITIFVNPEVALYILNQKRASLAQLESQFGISILIEADASLSPADHRFDGQRNDNQRNDNQRGDRSERQNNRNRNQNQNQSQNQTGNGAPSAPPSAEDGDEDQPKRRRRGKRGGRRRKRRGGEEDSQPNEHQATEGVVQDEGSAPAANEQAGPSEDGSPAEENANNEGKKPRRSRRRRRASGENNQNNDSPAAGDAVAEPVAEQAVSAGAEDAAEPASEKPAPRAKKAAKKAAKSTKAANAKTEKSVPSDEGEESATASAGKSKAVAKKTKASKKPPKAAKSAKAKADKPASADSPADGSADAPAERAAASSVEIKIVNIDDADVPKKKKGGWWSR
ncbi:MAG: Rne/Rng family ribonuclease [Candidatus Puniceispirillaceae bacterium]